tara:strand:+ start:322 stop:597 length:276 start_codon:yes stop_codon:yes gene_type:complete
MSKQLSKEQLELLQGLQKQFNDSKFEIADLEIKKSDLINVISDIKVKFAEQEKILMVEFGSNAVINLHTGEVKDQEPVTDAATETPLEVVE